MPKPRATALELNPKTLAWTWLGVCSPIMAPNAGISAPKSRLASTKAATSSARLGATAEAALRVIGNENASLAAEHAGTPAVTVAYVVPIPKPGENETLAVSLAHDLMGVAVAQKQANRTQTAGDRPLIRIVVVNIGDSSKQWQGPITRLIDMVRDNSAQYPLRAVAVSGWSLEPITQAIDALVAADVPVITVRLTADQLTSTPVSSNSPMVRIAPTNLTQAQAAAAYLRPITKRALIVQNTDPADYYAKSLGDGFNDSYPDATHTLLDPPEIYNGQRAGVATAMQAILQNVCVRKPDVVFFAGRPEELTAFTSQLPYRPCLDLPIRVMTGSAANTFAAAVARGAHELGAGMRANASVTFTGLAHPEEWRQSSAIFTDGSHRFLVDKCDVCFTTLFPQETLDDGAVIMSYDATMVAINAIRSSGGSSAGAVIQELKQIHGVRRFSGASGQISFAPNGEAINKATPILSVMPDGRLKFEQVSYPTGQPCTSDSEPC